MAYDAARGVTVLFGGFVGEYNGDTWEWNGAVWNHRLVSGPSTLVAHAMAYDAARGVTVLFGGYNGSAFNGGTWELNGTAWTQRWLIGPSPRDSPPLPAHRAPRPTGPLWGATHAGSTPQ